ncbi:MAG TPA: alpha/beta fold hydrolase [Povalibacter sp.]|uniref:alpha/beta hydrolase n=1 Tax=Povalibacter sp. TaxID=1962978 RepID=UPI002BD4E972|nr:alpha/beta fold hydrolase [Povalibacter sp.]HMN46853.1 alpha/beta fold hydrolase [Povalibacter sp.]
MTFRILALVPAFVLLSFAASTQAAVEQLIAVSTPTGELHGSLMLPDAGKSQTVALIIAGSGPTDRDGNNPMTRNDSLKLLATALAQDGIATVRYDKRGVGASAAALTDESKLVFHDLVADAQAWVKLLLGDPRFPNVVIIGHSEGATIGLLVARAGEARAYVSIAGPAQSAPQILRSQLRGRLPPELAQTNEKILTTLESGQSVQDVPPALMTLYRPSVQPYLIDWFRIVPTEAIRDLRVPCLLVQGDTDIQLPVQAAQSLHAANPATELVIVEGMNHVLKLVPNEQSKQLASYRDPSLPLAPALSVSIVRFIRAQTGGTAGS